MDNERLKSLPGVDIFDIDFLKNILSMFLKRDNDDEFLKVLEKLSSINFWDIAIPDANEETSKYKYALKIITKMRLQNKPVEVIKESLKVSRIVADIIKEAETHISEHDFNELLQLLIIKAKTLSIYKFFLYYNQNILSRLGKNIVDEEEFKEIINKIEELYEDMTFDKEIEESEYSNPEYIEKRYEELIKRLTDPTQTKIISSGIPLLDACFRTLNGFESGHIYIFGGPYGLGKTRLMVYFGSVAYLSGANVLHITIENKKEDVEMIYDSRFLQIVPEDIYSVIIKSKNIESAKEHVKGIIKSLKELVMNRDNYLEIKKFKAYNVSAAHIENHIRRKIANGYKKPDLVIIDHIDIMIPRQGYTDKLFQKGELVTADIKELAEKYNLVILTPSHIGREGVKKNIKNDKKGSDHKGLNVIGGEGISRSMAKNELADFICTMNQNPVEASRGIIRLFVDKNRNGIDKMIIPIKMDKGIVSIKNLDDNELNEMSEVIRNHVILLKKRLAKKKKIEESGKMTEEEKKLFDLNKQSKENEINKETGEIEQFELEPQDMIKLIESIENDYELAISEDQLVLLTSNKTYLTNLEELIGYLHNIGIDENQNIKNFAIKIKEIADRYE